MGLPSLFHHLSVQSLDAGGVLRLGRAMVARKLKGPIERSGCRQIL